MKKWLIGIAPALALLVGMVAPVGVAVAADQPGQGLEISPPVLELNADPGQIVNSQIRVKNLTGGTLIVRGEVNDFGAGTTEDGSPKIFTSETGATRYSLRTWVQGVPNLTLASGELKSVNVAIVVPKNAEPGGHYAVIRFTGLPPNMEGTGVSLSASVGTLVLLRVSGNITHDLKVASFTTAKVIKAKGKQDELKNTSFFEYGPVVFQVRFANDGSVHEKPTGRIVIKNMSGKVISELPVNNTGGNVLPGSVREFTQTLEKKNLFGYFTANMDATYLNGTKKLTATTHFWIIPWKAIALTIILIVILFILLRWGLKKYNAHVIAQARKR